MVADVRWGERKIVKLIAPGTAFYSTGERPGASQGLQGLASRSLHHYRHKMSAAMNHRDSPVLEQEGVAS